MYVKKSYHDALVRQRDEALEQLDRAQERVVELHNEQEDLEYENNAAQESAADAERKLNDLLNSGLVPTELGEKITTGVNLQVARMLRHLGDEFDALVGDGSIVLDDELDFTQAALAAFADYAPSINCAIEQVLVEEANRQQVESQKSSISTLYATLRQFRTSDSDDTVEP